MYTLYLMYRSIVTVEYDTCYRKTPKFFLSNVSTSSIGGGGGGLTTDFLLLTARFLF